MLNYITNQPQDTISHEDGKKKKKKRKITQSIVFLFMLL